MFLRWFFYENLVQVPLPIPGSPHPIGPISPDLGGEHRSKSIPPKPDRLVTDFNPPFMQEIFDIAKR